MTAFAIDFRRDRLTVAGDTLGYTPDRREVKPLGYVSKILPIPHLKAVLLSRGMLAITAHAATQIMLSPTLFTLEAAAAALPGILSRVTDEYAAAVEMDDWRSLGLLEVVFGGWSEVEGRMRLWSLDSYAGYEARADSGEQFGLLPFPRLPKPFMPVIDGDPADSDLVDIIQAAGRYFAEPASGMAGARVGGEVLAIEITPGGMSQRTLHRFADYQETLHAAAAVVSRIERGDMHVDVAASLVPVHEAAADASSRGLTRAQRRRAEALARKGRRAA
jgi:hypothetical protein